MMMMHQFSCGQASATITPLDKQLYLLKDLRSDTRGQGHARGVMQLVVDFADANAIDIILTVQRYGRVTDTDLTNSQLESFYARFGFVRHPKFTRRPVRMIRYHSQELHVS